MRVNAIKVKNLTTLTDFSALFRAALYLSGDPDQATEDGINVRVREGVNGTKVITITEKRLPGLK